MSRFAAAALLTAAALSSASAAFADDFTFQPPGTLVSGSGTGRVDDKVYAPGMRFPIETGPAYANSQVWGFGGSQGPGGSQCDVGNFSYPWWDNYCETRSWDMPLCPSGTGHQGQDIRAASCDANEHWVVASEAGSVTNVGSYSVYVTAADGTRYDYLHMGSVQVSVGDDVTKGQRIGKVSNEFGGTPTTVHLHFNLRQNVSGLGDVYVPPYLSLVTSYQALVGPPPTPAAGLLESATCDALSGYAQSPSDPDAPIDVRFYFDGAAGDGATVGHPFLADLPREDLCDTLGSCDHGFAIPPPLSLFDGLAHEVRAYASDGTSTTPELGQSPATMTCNFELPSGVRRVIESDDVANAWHFSPFWDQIEVSAGVIEALPTGEPLAARPRLVRDETGALFLIDAELKRAVSSPALARIWDFDANYAEPITSAELAELADGPELMSRPIVLRSVTGELFLIDSPPGAPPGEGGAGAGGASGDDAGDEGCSCRVTTSGSRRGGGLALLGLLLLARKRRFDAARPRATT